MLKAVIAAVELVAAEEIMPRYLKVELQTKSDGTSLTEADLAAQESLTRKLQTILNVPVIGEEMSEADQIAHWGKGSGSVWCIDPIDGTSNFARGLPYFAVSVALIREGRSVLGVVYDPVGKEMFAAERGRGACLNGAQLLRVNVAQNLAGALASVDMKRLKARLAMKLASDPPYSSHRCLGASTLDWCYAATGRYDVYLHGGQKMWDYAAGSLVLEEVGGHACTLEHDDFHQSDVWQRSVVASLDKGLFEEWKSWLKAA
jgi:myo-inositol-1(or 4)-monophosphatase